MRILRPGKNQQPGTPVASPTLGLTFGRSNVWYGLTPAGHLNLIDDPGRHQVISVAQAEFGFKPGEVLVLTPFPGGDDLFAWQRVSIGIFSDDLDQGIWKVRVTDKCVALQYKW